MPQRSLLPVASHGAGTDPVFSDPKGFGRKDPDLLFE